MAHMSQECKAKLAPEIKKILAKYGIKGSLSVDNHSTLVLNIKSGKLDFVKAANKAGKEQWARRHPDWEWTDFSYFSVNPYYVNDTFKGAYWAELTEEEVQMTNCLTELVEAMNVGNWNKSDTQTDYFNVGWYININIGKWDRPYMLVKA